DRLRRDRPAASRTGRPSTSPRGKDPGARDSICASHQELVTVVGSIGTHITDTIVALATAPGRGAIAVVRVSGPSAFQIVSRHLGNWPLEPRIPHLCDVLDGNEKLDQALVTLFPGPHSFTGEDIVEISTHGGYLVPSSVVAALILSGARQ